MYVDRQANCTPKHRLHLAQTLLKVKVIGKEGISYSLLWFRHHSTTTLYSKVQGLQRLEKVEGSSVRLRLLLYWLLLCNHYLLYKTLACVQIDDM